MKNMKKLAIAAAILTASSFAQAANFVSFDVDRVTDTKTKVQSTAQIVRAGYDAGGLNYGLQVRTATFENSGMLNSVEGTVGKAFGPFTPFAGVGHDNGSNGARGKDYQYGLVGVNTGMPLGPVYGFAGIKTRVNLQDNTPNQTVTFAGVSYPLSKAISASLGVSASREDIKENAFGFGLRVGF
jgi:hypothetical protein